ncbi:MAG TPA: hypothetical protein VE396_12215 [Xanthobacteraceae bacterium]|nr:hypothetical protein [Xanthobacteraceae bacterium]
MTKWVQAIRQTTTYLGVVMIAVIWSGVVLLASQEHERAHEDAVRQGSNLTRVLEEYVQRIVQQSDNVLLALRRDYQRDPEHFDMGNWMTRTQFHNNLTAHIGITDANGFVILSSRGTLSAPVYVGDRTPFMFQRDHAGDQLFISDPVVGGVSKELSVQFTRRFDKPDGTFDGTVAISLNVAEIERFFSSLDLGAAGMVSLVHADGVVLARGGRDAGGRRFAGMKVNDTPLLHVLQRNPAGSYWNLPATTRQFDRVSRLISASVFRARGALSFAM